jgi:hypothetical protein
MLLVAGSCNLYDGKVTRAYCSLVRHVQAFKTEPVLLPLASPCTAPVRASDKQGFIWTFRRGNFVILLVFWVATANPRILNHFGTDGIGWVPAINSLRILLKLKTKFKYFDTLYILFRRIWLHSDTAIHFLLLIFF